MNLTEMADLYGSDKGTKYSWNHLYTPFYEEIFNLIRFDIKNLLEIGVCLGCAPFPLLASHKMWRDYFPNAYIYGFDILDFKISSCDRITILQGDQGNRDDLLQIKEKCNEFDVIIDDGSHFTHHQYISFGFLFPLLKSGGIYIIEDVCVSPERSLLGFYNETYILLNDFLKNKKIKTDLLYDSEKKYLEENILKIVFYEDFHKNYFMATIFKK